MRPRRVQGNKLSTAWLGASVSREKRLEQHVKADQPLPLSPVPSSQPTQPNSSDEKKEKPPVKEPKRAHKTKGCTEATQGSVNHPPDKTDESDKTQRASSPINLANYEVIYNAIEPIKNLVQRELTDIEEANPEYVTLTALMVDEKWPAYCVKPGNNNDSKDAVRSARKTK
ncbi:unnamed protein product, partial [Mesorhabditis spiculigera]